MSPRPVLLLAVVLSADAVLDRVAMGLVPTGLVDWAGHLATAALVLLAGARAGRRLPVRDVRVVLAASVLIDLDHVPLYAGLPGVEAAGGRPFTHSLLTVAALLLVAAATGWRLPRLLALGVLLHLLRDVATGPGVPLLWPADVVVRLPYAAYLAVLAGLVLVALVPAGSLPAGSRARP